MSDNNSENNSEQESRYKYFYTKGKKYFKENDYEQCLDALKKAYKIKQSEKLQTQINKIENMISGVDSNEEVKLKPGENKILIENKYYFDKVNYYKLYNYQREGILWLFKLFENKKGGILADDMGLGKTVQVIFFLRELFESDIIKTGLLVMPKSLLINWEREFLKWAPNLRVLMYTGTERERERNFGKIRRSGGILLTTYGTIMNNWEEINYDSTFKWNIVALDEGHKIKNPSSKTFKSVNAIRAGMRLVMTGTAVQNKLKELWSLFDFTHQGSLLGGYPTFASEYEKPLTQSRNKDASETEKIYGNEIADSLKARIKPYFLRRTKEEVTKVSSDVNFSGPTLMRKNDLIVWIQMTTSQIEMYQKFLQLDDIKQLLTMSDKRSPLLELNILKKICDHPRLMKAEHCAELGMTFANSIYDVDISQLQQESGKMEFLLRLLKELVNANHKCLVFSQSKVILNIIQIILINNDVITLRLDGDVLKPIERQNIVDSFNNDPSYQVLLLTSQVGGVGLTLTGADRAIIYDLSWNPSIDAQAVDRVYRIGQKQNVVVYRLITCGTVEEKIYRRQIFKDSVNRQTTGIQKTDNNPYRYFTQGELLELFTLDDPHTSNTQIQLEEMHSKNRKSDANLDEHVSWLMDQNIFGLTDHDLMFTEEEEVLNIDDETRGRLEGNRRNAESKLEKEAMLLENEDEKAVRLMMGKMTLKNGGKKGKEQITIPEMFIPSQGDIKRPGYNVLSKTKALANEIKKPFRQNPRFTPEGVPINYTHTSVPGTVKAIIDINGRVTYGKKEPSPERFSTSQWNSDVVKKLANYRGNDESVHVDITNSDEDNTDHSEEADSDKENIDGIQDEESSDREDNGYKGEESSDYVDDDDRSSDKEEKSSNKRTSIKKNHLAEESESDRSDSKEYSDDDIGGRKKRYITIISSDEDVRIGAKGGSDIDDSSVDEVSSDEGAESVNNESSDEDIGEKKQKMLKLIYSDEDESVSKFEEIGNILVPISGVVDNVEVDNYVIAIDSDKDQFDSDYENKQFQLTDDPVWNEKCLKRREIRVSRQRKSAQLLMPKTPRRSYIPDSDNENYAVGEDSAPSMDVIDGNKDDLRPDNMGHVSGYDDKVTDVSYNDSDILEESF